MEEYPKEFSADQMISDEDEIISFGVYMTGYDEWKIKRMYDYWRKFKKNK